jgi:hypothetical protein
MVSRQPRNGHFLPRNPLPAQGGTAPEALQDAVMFAPAAFRAVLQRAITAEDYARLAADNARRLAERPRLLPVRGPAIQFLPGPSGADPRSGLEEEPGEVAVPLDPCLVAFRPLQGAKAGFFWTGSWYEVRVALDPLGTVTGDTALVAEVERYLEPYRRIGHDLRVRPAAYVPLDVGLSVCVLPGYQRDHVRTALRAVLGSRLLPDGRRGLFDPDVLTFGQAIHASRVVAAAQAVAGVREAELTRLTRFLPGTPPPAATDQQIPASGALLLGPFEIARLDNRPNRPDDGRLTILLRGGR